MRIRSQAATMDIGIKIASLLEDISGFKTLFSSKGIELASSFWDFLGGGIEKAVTSFAFVV